MIVPLMIIVSEAMSEDDVVKQLKEAIAIYEGGGGVKAKEKIMFAALLATMKFRPGATGPVEAENAIKEYFENHDWMKAKPKKN